MRFKIEKGINKLSTMILNKEENSEGVLKHNGDIGTTTLLTFFNNKRRIIIMSGSCIKQTQVEEKSLLNLKKNSTVKGLVNSHTVDHQITSCNQVDRNTSTEGQSSASQIGGQMQKGDITDSNEKNEENKNWCPVKNVGITSNTDQQLVDSNRAVEMKEVDTKV